MCGRYTLTSVDPQAMAARFGVREAARLDPATLGRFNVCPTEPIAIVTAEGEARTVRWGLVPPWPGPEPINARSESVAQRRPFAALLDRPEHRCLVLADGWYEWLRAEAGGERLPFRYTVDGGGPFAFAGLWDATRTASACILTTAANVVCAPVHDRMPCVLASPEVEEAWLAGERDGLLTPLEPARTAAAPANPEVNRAGVEGPRLLEPPPPPAQLSLLG